MKNIRLVFSLGILAAVPALALLWLLNMDWYVADIAVWLLLFIGGGILASAKKE